MSRRLTLTLLFHEEELLILQLVDVVLNLFPCTVFVCKKRVPTSLCLLDRVLELSKFLLPISIHYAVSISEGRDGGDFRFQGRGTFVDTPSLRSLHFYLSSTPLSPAPSYEDHLPEQFYMKLNSITTIRPNHKALVVLKGGLA